MWRYVAGAFAALLLSVAGMLFWSSQAGTKSILGAPPASEQAPLGAVDVAAPLEASDRTREKSRFSRYDADENGSVSREEYLQSRRKSYARLDLDGDGSYEVVWNGSVSGTTIYAGRTGEMLFNDETINSGTVNETPIIADVDADGHAELALVDGDTVGANRHACHRALCAYSRA